MEINYDKYLVNEKLKYNRFSFEVMEIGIYGKTYTRLKVYIYIPYLHFNNKPIKVLDVILLEEVENNTIIPE